MAQQMGADQEAMLQLDMARMSVLKDKRTLLSNPGTMLTDIYYSSSDTTVSDVECTFDTGRYTVNLTSPSFGGQSQIIIPNDALVSTIYLHLRLPAVTQANTQLPRGWGYASINQISYILGSSNTSQLQISGQSMLSVLGEQCETSEKKSELMLLGGEAVSQPTTLPYHDAYLILLLPFSRASGFHSKKPLDSQLLANPITVLIAFNQPNTFIGGSGAPTYISGIGSKFSVAEIIARQGRLTNQADSVKSFLQANPFQYSPYPFLHAQTFIPPSFGASPPSGNTQSLTLQSIINGDLTGLIIGVVKNSDLVSTASGAVNPFNYVRLQNVVIAFNGTVFYNSPSDMYRLFNMHSQFGASYMNNVLMSGTTSPFASSPVSNYLIRVDFSRIKTLSFENNYANTWRIGNNVLTINFNTADPAPDTNMYTMFVSYIYNGIIEFRNGSSGIYFD